MKTTLTFIFIRRRDNIYDDYQNDYAFFLENKRKIYDKCGERGEWPSELRRCNQNGKVSGSNSTKCLVRLMDSTLIRVFC